MALRNERLTSIVFGFMGAGVFMTFYHAGPAMAQAAKNLMIVQPSTPGTPQTGHANITGTMKAGQFAGGGGGLTGLNASQITTGTLPSSALSGTYSNQVGLTNSANIISGNGGGLTNLSSSALTGVISASLMPFSFARLDAANVFGAFNNQFNGRVGVGIAPPAGTSLTVLGVAPDWAIRAQNTLGPTVVDIGGPNVGVSATNPAHSATLVSGINAVRGVDIVTGADGRLGTLGMGVVGTSGGGNEGRLGTAVAGVDGRWGVVGPRGQLGTVADGVVATHPAGFQADLAGATYGVRSRNLTTGSSVLLNDVLAAVNISITAPEVGLQALDTTSLTSAAVLGPTGALSGNGMGIPGVVATSNLDHSVSASHAAPDPTLAALYGSGAGSTGPGVPNAAALRLDNGAVRVGGPLPNRFAGSVIVPGPWLPIFSCFGGDPVHAHTIGYYCDVPVANNLVIPGPPNFGTIIQVSVESMVPPAGNTSFYIQAHSKMPGGFMIRVTRMGDPGGCAPPMEPVSAHYTLINPVP